MAAAAAMPAGRPPAPFLILGGGCNVGAVLTLLIQLVSSCFGYLFSFGMLYMYIVGIWTTLVVFFRLHDM